MAISTEVLTDIAIMCDTYGAVASLTTDGIRIATQKGDRWICSYKEIEMLIDPTLLVEVFLKKGGRSTARASL